MPNIIIKEFIPGNLYVLTEEVKSIYKDSDILQYTGKALEINTPFLLLNHIGEYYYKPEKNSYTGLFIIKIIQDNIIGYIWYRPRELNHNIKLWNNLTS